MKIIEPIAMTDGQLTAASIVENDAAVWDVATSYVLNDEVISLTSHSVYVCEVANTGIDPDTDTAGNWTRLGATNRWKAFDTLLSDPASDAAAISFTITPDSAIYGIALFALEADQIIITVKLDALVKTYTIDLINVDEVVGWYSWLFSGVQREAEALQLDLPYFGAGTSYKIDITGAGTVKVGQIVMGPVAVIGVTQWGAEIGIQDYSRKDRDAYGNAIILERRFSRTASFPVGVDASRVRLVQRKLEEFRARPAVWIGDERAEFALIIYGFYTGYTHVLTQDNWSRALIDVEGLV